MFLDHATSRRSTDLIIQSVVSAVLTRHRRLDFEEHRDEFGVPVRSRLFLRHGFASALIVGLGLDPVQVSRQLGHAAPSITLDTYSHLFDRARHADDIRTRMASSGIAAAVTGA